MACPLLAKYARNGAPGRVGEREGGDGEFVLRGINSRLSTGRRVYRLVYLVLSRAQGEIHEYLCIDLHRVAHQQIWLVAPLLHRADRRWS
jgi:hypothetical protein